MTITMNAELKTLGKCKIIVDVDSPSDYYFESVFQESGSEYLESALSAEAINEIETYISDHIGEELGAMAEYLSEMAEDR